MMICISVVMPVYNAERFVAAAVRSVLNQTFTDFELVIIDDGSTDRSAEAIQTYARRDDRIRLHKTPNRGVVAARNTGLELARGDLIAVMDADDESDPRRFELQKSHLDSHPDVVAVGSYATTVDPEGNHLGEARVPLTHEEIDSAHLRGVDSMFNPAVMVRTDAVRQVGGYRPGIMPGEDYDLWLRLGEAGKLANLPVPLLTWRRTTSGLTVRNQANQWRMNKRILDDAWARRGLDGEPTVPPVQLATAADLHQQWGWMALKNGYISTARKYARRSLAARPWDSNCWRLWYCALRGR